MADYTLVATVGASVYDFAANGIHVLGDVGLGEPPVERIETSGAQQHGATDRGFYLRPRNFAIALGLEAVSRSDYWHTIRRDLVRLFRPSPTKIELRFSFVSGAVYQIDCHYRAGMDFPYRSRTAYLEAVTVELRASDPTLYDPVEDSLSFALGGGGDAFDIPLAIPWPIGASSLSVIKTVSYAGSWEAHPILRIVGPITNCLIENLTTGKNLDFQGTTISAGDWYEIDTRYGQKSVLDQDGNNVTDDLTDDSDLGTFALEAPEGVEPTKNNDIRVSGTSVTVATEVYMRYHTRHSGI